MSALEVVGVFFAVIGGWVVGLAIGAGIVYLLRKVFDK